MKMFHGSAAASSLPARVGGYVRGAHMRTCVPPPMPGRAPCYCALRVSSDKKRPDVSVARIDDRGGGGVSTLLPVLID